MPTYRSEDYQITKNAPPFIVNLDASLVSLDVNIDTWLTLAWGFVKSLLISPSNVVINIHRFHEFIVVEGERSRARIRAGALLSVTQIYTKAYNDALTNRELPDCIRDVLINNIWIALEEHLEDIHRNH